MFDASRIISANRVYSGKEVADLAAADRLVDPQSSVHSAAAATRCPTAGLQSTRADRVTGCTAAAAVVDCMDLGVIEGGRGEEEPSRQFR